MELMELMLSSSAFSTPLSGYRKVLKRQARAIRRTAKFAAVRRNFGATARRSGRKEGFRSLAKVVPIPVPGSQVGRGHNSRTACLCRAGTAEEQHYVLPARLGLARRSRGRRKN